MGCYKLTYKNSDTPLFVSANNFSGCEKERGRVYDLEYRNYDPVLGRMNGVDPMASKYSSLSPYNFAFNDPVSFNDPSGADPNPGEPDHVTRRNLGTECNCSNNFSRNYRGGSMFGMFEQGWSVGSGSLSYGAFNNADNYFATANENADVAWALGLLYGNSNVSVSGGKATIYTSSGQSYSSNYGNISGITAINPVEFNLSGAGDFAHTYAGQDFIKLGNGIQPYSDPLSAIIGSITSMAETVGLNRAAQLSGFKSSLNIERLITATKFSKGAGVAGLVIGTVGAGINILTGNGTGVDVIDIGAMILAGTAAAILAPVALPWIAGAAMIYGITSFVFEDQINDSAFGKGASDVGNYVLGLTPTTIKIK